MTRYFRIQPAGLGIDHKSEDSNGDRISLHVFNDPVSLWGLDVSFSSYGDEIVIIDGGDCWDNGDVEGVAIDGSAAHVVARMTLSQFVATYAPGWLQWVADDLDCEVGDLDEHDILSHRVNGKCADRFLLPF